FIRPPSISQDHILPRISLGFPFFFAPFLIALRLPLSPTTTSRSELYVAVAAGCILLLVCRGQGICHRSD
ncbi:hypothetical protein B0H13DRAFT_2079049, partial [Mycena leptocephala]